MGLYETLNDRYDEIFPVNPAAIGFILARVPDGAPRRILDLGSATGGHALAFAALGWDALGIELSPAMARKAQSRSVEKRSAGSASGSTTFVQGDMRRVAEFVAYRRFGAAICLGNTLSHIEALELEPFLATIVALLVPEAPLVLQTLNYAHPEIGAGFRFPDIEVPGLKFARRYAAAEPAEAEGKEALSFMTEVETPQGRFEDSVTLYPHKPDVLADALSRSGFERIEFRSSWDGANFAPERDRYLITVGYAGRSDDYRPGN